MDVSEKRELQQNYLGCLADLIVVRGMSTISLKASIALVVTGRKNLPVKSGGNTSPIT